MIIGSRHISDADILKNGNQLRILAQKLIPICCVGNRKLLDNQLFFLISRFRNQTSVPYLTQQRIIGELAESIESITGTMGTIHDIEDILSSVDVNKVFSHIFGKQSTKLTESDLHLAIEAMLRGGKL